MHQQAIQNLHELNQKQHVLKAKVDDMKTDQDSIDKKLDTTARHSIAVHNLVKEN